MATETKVKSKKAVIEVFVYIYCPQCEDQLQIPGWSTISAFNQPEWDILPHTVQCSCGAEVVLPRNPFGRK